MKENAAEAYLAQKAKFTTEAEIVDVPVPSGSIFKMQKPGRFGMIFGIGQLPINAASKAMRSWQDQGAIADDTVTQDDQIKLAEIALRICEKVVELSVSPKLVFGAADRSKGELSTDDVADADLEVLFHWVQSGGTKSTSLGNFPGRPDADPVPGTNRKARRTKAKQSRGNRG